jgi:hypothetical protein
MRDLHAIEEMRFALEEIMPSSMRRQAYLEALDWVLGGPEPLNVFGASDPEARVREAAERVRRFILIHAEGLDTQERANLTLIIGVLDWASGDHNSFDGLLEILHTWPMGPMVIP